MLCRVGSINSIIVLSIVSIVFEWNIQMDSHHSWSLVRAASNKYKYQLYLSEQFKIDSYQSEISRSMSRYSLIFLPQSNIFVHSSQGAWIYLHTARDICPQSISDTGVTYVSCCHIASNALSGLPRMGESITLCWSWFALSEILTRFVGNQFCPVGNLSGFVRRHLIRSKSGLVQPFLCAACLSMSMTWGSP